MPTGRPRSAYPADVDPADVNALVLWMARVQLRPETLAAIMNVSLSTVYKWRRGEQTPSKEVILRLQVMSGGEVGGWE
jgi:DNA-binding transcriptional regulator YiaG